MIKIFNSPILLFLSFITIAFFGCNEDDDNSLPQVEAGFTYTLDSNTGTVTFLNTSEKANTYQWDFGDGSTSTEINPVRTYPTGTYTVKLTASNVAGASDIFEDQVVIALPEEIMLPMTFDGANVDYTPSLFNGASFEVVDNPAPGGSNNVASQVGAITNSGAAFEGLFFDLGSNIDLTTLKSIKMNFWSDKAVDVLMKLEEGTEAAIEITASHGGTGWEELFFTFNNSAQYARLTLFVDGPGTTAGTFYIDDVQQTETPVAEFDSGLLMNGDFENGAEPWIGNGLNVVTEGGNSFNLVNVEQAGNAFDVNLSQVVSLTQGTNYTLTFYASSDRERTILAGIGLNEAPWTNTTKEITLSTELTKYTLQLAASDFGIPNSRVIFDMGAAVGTVVIDKVALTEGGDGSDSNNPDDGNNGGGDSFDSGLLMNGDFENGAEPWIGNGLDVVTEGGNSFNLANVEQAGNAFDVNLSQVVSLIQGTNYTLTFYASSDRERTILAGIGLNEAPWTNTTKEITLSTELTKYTLQLAASDFGIPNSRVLFDMGAAVGVVVIDEVTLTEGGDGSDSNPDDGNNGGGDSFDSGLLMNGDFENGASPWTIGVGSDAVPTVMADGNTYYQVDVAAAGNPFDVNMSQTGLSLTEGSTYKLSFDAWTNAATASRDIVAGIGRSGGDFANVTETKTITTTRQTFELNLTVNFSDESNGRVIFDLGAAIGQVNIDDVSLFLNDDGGNSGGGDTSGSGSAPNTAAPTPPARDAANVISLYSDAYTNITVSEWSTSWDDANVTDDMAGGNNVKKVLLGDTGGFWGVDFSSNSFDASSFTHFHMDYYIVDDLAAGQVLNPKWSNHAAGGGEVNALDLTNPVAQTGQWVSIDIPISDFMAINGADKNNLAQFILSGAQTVDEVYIDNIYLYKE